jgi:hypothetical protein
MLLLLLLIALLAVLAYVAARVGDVSHPGLDERQRLGSGALV